jgi:cyclohexanone monooxygenase
MNSIQFKGLRLPNIPEQFQPFKGPIIHSAKWNSCDLENKKVAVIGSGCSAVQIIPTIETKVKQLLSFQR